MTDKTPEEVLAEALPDATDDYGCARPTRCAGVRPSQTVEHLPSGGAQRAWPERQRHHAGVAEPMLAALGGHFAVDEPNFHYQADPLGPWAMQAASVRVVVTRDRLERDVFSRGIRLAPRPARCAHRRARQGAHR